MQTVAPSKRAMLTQFHTSEALPKYEVFASTHLAHNERLYVVVCKCEKIRDLRNLMLTVFIFMLMFFSLCKHGGSC